MHVRFVDFFSDHRDFPLPIFWQRRKSFARDRVYSCDDSALMRIDHLRAVTEVNFIAVVVRRIVTRCYYDASVRFEMANSERKFRNRTRPIEHERVATVCRRNFRSELSEFL